LILHALNTIPLSLRGARLYHLRQPFKPRSQDGPPLFQKSSLLLLALAALAACGDSSEPDTSAIPVASIVITPENPAIAPGGSLQLVATLRGAGGQLLHARVVTWASADSSVAIVDPDGNVAQVQNGEVTVTASSEGKSATTSVLVSSPLAVASVAIKPGSRHVLAGATMTLNVFAYDANGDEIGTPNATWTTSNAAALLNEGPGPVNSYWLLAGFQRSGSVTITASINRIRATADFTIDQAAWKSVSQGGSWHCGVTTDGRNYCWPIDGSDRPDGALATIPTELGGSVRLDTISAGGTIACGLASGAVYCWGQGSGTGLGDTHNATPTLVGGLPTAKAVAAGYQHACALDTTGLAWCWGYNLTGQLGDGTFQSSATPVAVAGGHHFVSIDAGFYHTCAVSVDEALYCWGSDEYGQLGNDASNENCLPSNPGMKCSTTPDLVAGSLHMKAVSAAQAHTCALATDDSAWCWGENDHGAIGSGTMGGQQLTPVMVAGGHHFTGIAAGWSQFTCALESDGKAWCWGDGSMLGAGASPTVATPTAVATTQRFAAIDAGSESTCAVTADGVGWCWGSNILGALGSSRIDNYVTIPVRLPG